MGFAVMSLTRCGGRPRQGDRREFRRRCAGYPRRIKKGGCAGMEYAIDLVTAANPKDDLVEHQGAKVWVAPEAVLYLLGTRMDFEVTTLRSGFTFSNPNQTSACGCGKSVELKPADLAALAAKGDAVVRAG